MWVGVISVVDRPVILGLVSSWVNTSGLRIGRAKHGVYWCIYACIGRMLVCCVSSAYQVYYGVITVPMYQGDSILGRLNTWILYVVVVK